MTTFRVVKMSYSARPWRIVDQDGNQLAHKELYPSSALHADLMAPIQMDYAFSTRAEAVEALGRLAGEWFDALRERVGA